LAIGDLAFCRFGVLPIWRFADLAFCRFGDLAIWRLGDLAIGRFGARMTIGNHQLRLVNRQSQSSVSIDNLNRQPSSSIANRHSQSPTVILNRQPSFSIANQQSKKPQSPIASPQSI
jgi:hypothetical protein